ncbi:MAG: DUF4339 domain-containing protein [Methylacidiphilales bacterium]|nr:DUF4339 domain-containing protein [Candidatus Methylacidiphilales bacterium]
MSNIYLHINGEQQGPYPIENVRAMMASGELGSDTLAWMEGQADWQPVSLLFGVPVPASPPPVSTGKFRVGSFLSGIGVTLAVIGAILLGLLVVVGAFIGYTAYVGNGLDKSSKDYVDEAIPAIVTNWSQEELTKRESKAFQQAVTDEQLTKLFTLFHRLGALKSYDGCKGEANMNYTPSVGKVITAVYLGRATFDNGEAEIKIGLIQEDGVWKIQAFNVNSPVFMQ